MVRGSGRRCRWLRRHASPVLHHGSPGREIRGAGRDIHLRQTSRQPVVRCSDLVRAAVDVEARVDDVAALVRGQEPESEEGLYLCVGHIAFAEENAALLTDILPPLLIVRVTDPDGQRLAQLIDLLATELALATGYQSESAFSTAFRRVVGLPPTKFRDEARCSVSGGARRPEG